LKDVAAKGSAKEGASHTPDDGQDDNLSDFDREDSFRLETNVNHRMVVTHSYILKYITRFSMEHPIYQNQRSPKQVDINELLEGKPHQARQSHMSWMLKIR